MRIVVYLPLLLSVLLTLTGPGAARRMPPKAGTRLLLAAGLMCALTSQLALAMLAATLIGRLPLIAAVGAWSADSVSDYTPVSSLTAKLATVALTGLAGLLIWGAIRRLNDLRRADRACRRIGDRAGRLVVLDRPEPEAFAIPGRGDSGRIVVSTGMLHTLDATERRVLIAHEAAHLNHRHHRHRTLALVIAAANPILATLPGAVHHLTERWADEDAAATVTDRKLAARALARAGLATHRRSPLGHAVMCFGRGGIAARVLALLDQTPPRRPLAAVLLAAMAAACLLSTVEAGRDTALLFDQARDQYHARSVSITTAALHETHHLVTALIHRR